MCGFRDEAKGFADKGVTVVGISGDRAKTLGVFKKVQKVDYMLLADEKGAAAKLFGVPVTEGEKSHTAKIDGKDETFTRGCTISRWTFVIDKDGKICYVNPKVSPADDAKAVLEALAK